MWNTELCAPKIFVAAHYVWYRVGKGTLNHAPFLLNVADLNLLLRTVKAGSKGATFDRSFVYFIALVCIFICKNVDRAKNEDHVNRALENAENKWLSFILFRGFRVYHRHIITYYMPMESTKSKVWCKHSVGIMTICSQILKSGYVHPFVSAYIKAFFSKKLYLLFQRTAIKPNWLVINNSAHFSLFSPLALNIIGIILLLILWTPIIFPNHFKLF